MWEAATLGITMLILAVIVWGVCEYIRVKRQLYNIVSLLTTKLISKMEIDEVIDELLESKDHPSAHSSCETEVAGLPAQTRCQKSRERLAALAAGGQAQQYLGRAWTVEQIDALNDGDVEKLYARYEARLGATMTKTLRRATLQAYAAVASTVLPIPPENRHLLTEDLENDPFVSHALNSGVCELYHRYGMFLAPLTAALTTVNYCRFGHQDNVKIYSNNGESTDRQQCDGATDTSYAASDRPRDPGGS